LKPSKGKVVIKEERGREASKSRSPAVIRRPQSAPSKKAVKAPPPEPEATLGEFSKSLKLLGLDIPSTRTEATKLTNQEVKVATKEPTIRTRLLKRSGSYCDLTKNIKKDMKQSEFDALRSKVKDAVFEQWYFKKCEEERERKLKEEEKEAKLKKDKEEKQREVEEMSKEEFQKWCKLKKAQSEKEKKRKDIIEKGKTTKVVDKEEVERKNKEWLALKMKDFQKKKDEEERRRLEEEKKTIEQDKKRTEAEKTFLAWKESKTKELKERYLYEKNKGKEKQEALMEKRKDADLAFIGWKNRKTEKPKEKAKVQHPPKKEPPVQEAEKDEDKQTVKKIIEDHDEVDNNNRKLEEAKQAYEAWLDLIEEREEENLLFEEERKRILMWKPPWYAGGKALF
jgi:hypothetical protein